MKTLYLECGMGAAGDMLMAALYELLSEEQRRDFLETMNGLGLPGVEVTPVAAKTGGIAGTRMKVTVHGHEEHEHHHGHDGHEHDRHHHHHHLPLQVILQAVASGIGYPPQLEGKLLLLVRLLF